MGSYFLVFFCVGWGLQIVQLGVFIICYLYFLLIFFVFEDLKLLQSKLNYYIYFICNGFFWYRIDIFVMFFYNIKVDFNCI